jgi:hypothetical protein
LTSLPANPTVWTLGNSGGNDVFVVKYDPSGSASWVRRIGGTGTDQGMAITIDVSGNVCVAGYGGNTPTIFAADGTSTALTLGTTFSSPDAFVVKYTPDGSPLWARRIGGSGTEQGMSIASDVSGNICVAGYANSTATVFAADGISTAFSLGNSGSSSDAFVVKYNPDGSPLWVRRIAGTGIDQGTGVAVDSSKNVYVTGFTMGTASVFAADDTNAALTIANSGNNDAFVVKYDPDGSPLWVRRIAGSNNDQGLAVAFDSSKNVYLAGFTNTAPTVFAADGSSTAFSLGNSTATDAIVVKYDLSGTPLWVRRIGGSSNDQSLGIAVDSSGNVCITGYTSTAATVFAADGTSTAFLLGNTGSQDVFVVKYTTDGTPTWARRFVGPGTDMGMGIALDSSGNLYITGYATGITGITNIVSTVV